MNVFRIVRGSVHQFSGNGGNVQPSVVAIDGIDSSGAAILVSNFQVTDNEKLGIIQCFNNTNHLYAFGHDPEASGFSVTYIVFMGEECMEDSFSDGGRVGDMVMTYNNLKISERKALVSITFGNGTNLSGAICSLDVGVFDPEMNALTITLAGKALRWD